MYIDGCSEHTSLYIYIYLYIFTLYEVTSVTQYTLYIYSIYLLRLYLLHVVMNIIFWCDDGTQMTVQLLTGLT